VGHRTWEARADGFHDVRRKRPIPAEEVRAVFERIVLPVDGSTHARKAADAAAALASRFDSSVTVLTVQEYPATWALDIGPPISEEGSEVVEDVVRALKDRGIDASGMVRVSVGGTVARDIVVVANDIEASLIVMGTRGLTDWQGLVLGSVAHQVAHLASCPVLVVR
jgi:nucleotide-binding universal stress UspA family protein